MTSFNLPEWAREILADDPSPRAMWPLLRSGSLAPPLKRAVPRPRRPSNADIEKKIANAKLIADALEFLLQVWPEIPGASVTLTPAQQDELKRIVLALPASVEL